MRSFTERLVVRAAGGPADLPLLKLRPAVRFEPEAPAAPPDHPVARPEAQAPAPRPPAAIGTRKPLARKPLDKPPSTSAAPVESEIVAEPAASVPFVPQSRPGVPAAVPVAPGEPVSSSTPSPQRAERAIAGPEPTISREEAGKPREPEPPLLRFDEPLANPVMRGDPVPERAPPAPTISIGRIDVQFLPQERPAAPPRPEPQRTRGFETYARARRGQSR